jgi:hypothetical protein
VTLSVPSAPGFLNVPATSSTGNYSLDWGLSSGATLYELEESTDAGFSSTVQVFLGASASFAVTGRTNGTYYYRVRGVNAVGMSGWTDGPNGCTVTVTQASLHVDAGVGNPGPSNEMPGALGVPVLHLRFSAGTAEGIILQSLQVNGTGSGDDGAEIASVRLIRDVNGDGIAGSGDVEVDSDTYSGDEGTVSFDLSTEAPVSGGDSAWYIVAYDFSPFALTGNTFSCSVTLPGDMQCAGMISMSAVSATGGTVSGGVKTITTSGAGSLSVSLGGNNPTPGQVTYPAADVSMLQMSLTASSMEGVQISRIQISSAGTGDEASGVSVRLYDDVNGDGQFSAGDVQLGTGAFSSDNGTVTFTGLTLTVPAGQSVQLVVVYDFAEGLVSGTYGALLAVGEDVEAVGVNSSMGITPTGAPVAGGMQMLVGGSGDGEAIFFMGGCAGGVVGPTGWAGWLVVVVLGLLAVRIRRKR